MADNRNVMSAIYQLFILSKCWIEYKFKLTIGKNYIWELLNTTFNIVIKLLAF